VFLLVGFVTGVVYLLLSFVYFHPTAVILKIGLGFSIPLSIKIILGIIIVRFTLSVSDLGDLID
jgi:hypothetical protein